MIERIVEQRTALSNQIRGLLAEHGIAFPKGISQLRATLLDVIEDADNGLSNVCRSEI